MAVADSSSPSSCPALTLSVCSDTSSASLAAVSAETVLTSSSCFASRPVSSNDAVCLLAVSTASASLRMDTSFASRSYFAVISVWSAPAASSFDALDASSPCTAASCCCSSASEVVSVSLCCCRSAALPSDAVSWCTSASRSDTMLALSDDRPLSDSRSDASSLLS